MFLEALPIVRDVAVVFLALQWMIFLALPLFVLYKIVGGLARFLPKVRPGIRTAHDYVRKGLGFVEQSMARIRSPFVWLNKSLLIVSERIRRFESIVTRR